MLSRQQYVGYLCNDGCLNGIAFLIDITQHLSDLNVKLQSKNQLINKMIEHIYSFGKKLTVMETQLSITVLTHFPCLIRLFQIC